jgi:Flp pilus assembly protein TadD
MLKRPEAIAAYEALLDVAPEDYNNRFNYAVALYLNDRPEEAKTELAKIQTTDLNLLVDVERLYLEMSDAPACIALWTWVYEKAPSAEALTHRARCKLMSGDKAGGEKDLRLAIEKEPQSSIAQYYLGKFLQKEGKKAEARKHFEQAAKVPDDFGKAAKAELKK